MCASAVIKGNHIRVVASRYICSMWDAGDIVLKLSFLTKDEFSAFFYLAKNNLSCMQNLKTSGFILQCQFLICLENIAVYRNKMLMEFWRA